MSVRLASILLLLMAAAAWAGDSINQSVSAPANGVLLIQNVGGSVRVDGWDREEVEVTGDLDKGVERIELTSEAGRTELRVILSRGSRGDRTDLIVKAPRNSRLEIETTSAEIEITNITGNQRITTISGDVETESLGKELEIKSVGGEIEVTGNGNTTRTVVSSMSGDVDITGAKPRI